MTKNNYLLITVLSALVLSGCGNDRHSSSNNASSSTTSSSQTSSSVDAETTFKIECPNSGLGHIEVEALEDGSYKLVVTPVADVTVNEVKVNGADVSLENGEYVFSAAKGENTISVTYDEPEEMSAILGAEILANNVFNKDLVGFNYVYRSLYKYAETLEDATNILNTYDAKLYSNGIYADVTIGEATGETKYYKDPSFTSNVFTKGKFVTYKVDDESYVRAMVPETYCEDGFAELLERNAYFDETTENLGYTDFAATLYANLYGESSYPEAYGYVTTEDISEENGVISIALTSNCEAVDYGDWILPEENNIYKLELDATTYEVLGLSLSATIYQTTSSSPIVTLQETIYDNITTGKLTEGEIPEVTNTDTIDPSYATLTKPSIQSDIADGDLSKEDATKILKNIWAYSENTRQSTATGAAYMYDEDYNEISGTSTMTTTAYKDYFLVSENVFVPDDKETYGDQIVVVSQKSVTPEGVLNVQAVNGVVDPYSSWTDYVGPQYSFKKNFSASPLMQDFSIGMIVKEASDYGLESFINEDEWGTFGMVYDDYSAHKNGDDITIRWSAATSYGEWGTDPAIYVEIVIEDNFVTSLSYGDSFDSLLTYTMTQGEYTEYTGEVFVITAN